MNIQASDAIATPIYLEFVCGVVQRHEMELAKAYLQSFRLVDEGRLTDDDWIEARRLAERIPRDRRPRGLVDCLIKAIANRLGYAVRTMDQGMPR